MDRREDSRFDPRIKGIRPIAGEWHKIECVPSLPMPPWMTRNRPLRRAIVLPFHHIIPEARTWWTLGPGVKPAGHGIANAAAERVHQVFFRMPVGREVNPLAAPALAAIIAKRLLQS